jgi:hypothetical protein
LVLNALRSSSTYIWAMLHPRRFASLRQSRLLALDAQALA